MSPEPASSVQFLLEISPQTAEAIQPALDAIFVAALMVEGKGAAPTVVLDGLHGRRAPAVFASSAPLQFDRQRLVPIREDIRFDGHSLSGDTLDGKGAPADRADGSFAVADPIRSKFNQSARPAGGLTAYEVWNGRPGFIEGLVRDWIRWQSSNDHTTFDRFTSVLKRLSPEDLGVLMPGKSVRIPGDPRDIPTIQHRYGTFPVTHASSGVQRVLLLAYLIIWSWQEHELAAQSFGRPPLRRMMVIVDELEAHLHPKWQRIVLPALMGVGDLLSSDLAIQMVAATHSPMILTSLEASFNYPTDVLYHLYGSGPSVKLEEIPFVKYGDVSGWLTSPLFGLQHARSREAEQTIEAAKALQLESEPNIAEVTAVSEKLRLHLSDDDKFWPRWLYFAEQHGVNL